MTLCCEALVYSTGYQMHPSTSFGCKDQTEHSQSSQSQALRTQNQMERKTSYSSHIRGVQQSLPKQRQVWRKLLSYQSVWGQLGQQVSEGPVPDVLPYGSSFL